jgi:hypothetical protein
MKNDIGDTLTGLSCIGMSVPLYTTGLHYLSNNGTNVYEAIANKAIALVCLGSAVALSYVPVDILRKDIRRYREYKKIDSHEGTKTE